MKKCSNCFQFKPLDEFYRKIDGHQARCKACNAEVVRGYRERLRRGEIKRRYNKAGMTRIVTSEFTSSSTMFKGFRIEIVVTKHEFGQPVKTAKVISPDQRETPIGCVADPSSPKSFKTNAQVLRAAKNEIMNQLDQLRNKGEPNEQSI